MKTYGIPQFKDSISLLRLISITDKWQKPEIPERLKNITKAPGQIEFHEICDVFRVKIGATKNPASQKSLQKLIIDWLYDFIRLNIKRGRVFELDKVLDTGLADCYGYAKIFITLGRYFGLADPYNST
jgi:hypothetical protein